MAEEKFIKIAVHFESHKEREEILTWLKRNLKVKKIIVPTEKGFFCLYPDLSLTYRWLLNDFSTKIYDIPAFKEKCKQHPNYKPIEEKKRVLIKLDYIHQRIGIDSFLKTLEKETEVMWHDGEKPTEFLPLNDENWCIELTPSNTLYMVEKRLNEICLNLYAFKNKVRKNCPKKIIKEQPEKLRIFTRIKDISNHYHMPIFLEEIEKNTSLKWISGKKPTEHIPNTPFAKYIGIEEDNIVISPSINCSDIQLDPVNFLKEIYIKYPKEPEKRKQKVHYTISSKYINSGSKWGNDIINFEQIKKVFDEISIERSTGIRSIFEKERYKKSMDSEDRYEYIYEAFRRPHIHYHESEFTEKTNNKTAKKAQGENTMKIIKKTEELELTTYKIGCPGINKTNVKINVDTEKNEIILEREKDGKTVEECVLAPVKRYEASKASVKIADGIIEIDVPVKEGAVVTIDVG